MDNKLILTVQLSISKGRAEELKDIIDDEDSTTDSTTEEWNKKAQTKIQEILRSHLITGIRPENITDWDLEGENI